MGTRKERSVLLVVVAVIGVCCSSDDSGGPKGGSGGSTPTVGGAMPSGGTIGSSGAGGQAGGAEGGTGATGGRVGSGGTMVTTAGGTLGTGGIGPLGQGGTRSAGGTTGTGGRTGAAGSAGATRVTGGRGGTGGRNGLGGTTTTNGGAGGTTTPNTAGLTVLTDTNRDGVVDDQDTAGLTNWAWKGGGAFFMANVDDDDKKGKVDSSDQVVNGTEDEADLARIVVSISSDAMTKAAGVSATVTTGVAETHLFEKTGSSWKLVSGALSQVAAQIELGLEAIRFADTDWDGFATVKVDLLDAAKTIIASEQVKLHVAPWIMLPNSAKTELLYISSTTSRLRPDLDKVLQSAGLPDAVASNPSGQDIWFQDTMEIGYTQLPGKPPMHVVMKAQRPNASDNVAITLLAPNFGFISIGAPRNPPSEEDHWIDWMGDLEVSHPVPDYPLGRIYYGKSSRTTFQPTIVKFLEAQAVQKPFALMTEWLIIQHVDEIVSFLPDKEGKAKMLIVSPAAANTVMGSGYDSGNQQIQKYIDEDIALFKTELGLTDNDILPIPTFFGGSGTNYAPIWSNPVNSVYINGTFVMGKTDTPAAIKTDIEKRLDAIGVKAAWVDDAEYDMGMGNVHCATNTKKTPLCKSFTDCLP